MLRSRYKGDDSQDIVLPIPKLSGGGTLVLSFLLADWSFHSYGHRSGWYISLSDEDSSRNQQP